jgi:hypothetical protein
MDDKLKNIKFSIRAIFIFEQLMDKIFELKTLSDFYSYYYSCLLAGKQYEETFETFINDLDKAENTGALNWFIEELKKHSEVENQFETKDENDELKKKSE